MIRWYDRQGNEITLEQWAKLSADFEGYRRVDETTVGGVRVSTVWLGLDHNWRGTIPIPLIFETMIFGGPHDELGWRWPTEAAAQAGHDRIVAALKDGQTLIEMFG